MAVRQESMVLNRFVFSSALQVMADNEIRQGGGGVGDDDDDGDDDEERQWNVKNQRPRHHSQRL